MTIASRPSSGVLYTQFVHALEARVPEVVDISRKEIVLYHLAEKMGFLKMSDAPQAEINPVLDSKDTTVTRFSTGYETFPTNGTVGAHAFYLQYANYASPVAMSIIDEQKIASPYELIDLAKTRAYKAGRAIGEDLESDLFVGTGSNSLSITGLEQWVFAKDHAPVSNTVANFFNAPRWRFRQAANVVAGWTRAAFTAEDVGGTHFENCSMDCADGGATNFAAALAYSISSGALSEGGQVFNKFYDTCSKGTDMPNLIISPYFIKQQYENTGTGTIQYVRTTENDQDLNLTFGGTRFKEARWVASELCVHSGLGSSSVVGAGSPLIYFLNTRWIELQQSKKMNFAMTDFARGSGQLAAAAQCVNRLQLKFRNPQTSGVAFDWGA